MDNIATHKADQYLKDRKEELVKPSLSSDKLLQALYFVWDAIDRSNLQVFLIGNTASQALKNQDLSGDKLTFGVRRNEWISGQGGIFRTVIEHLLSQAPKITDSVIHYTYQGVPIEIRVYKDNETLMQLDKIHYRYESFYIPNPLKTFEEKYQDGN